MKKVIYYVIAATLVAMPLTGCNSDEEIVKEPENANLPDEENEPIKEEQENAVRSIHLTDAQKQAVSRNNDFAFNFYRAVSQTEELKNKSNVVSPLSLTYVLGMLNAGATGQTGSEILKLLGFGEGDSQTVNELCKELIDNAPGVDNAVTLRLANLVATASNHSFTLADDYSQTVKDYYDCEATSLDFNSQTAVDYINGWCKEKTEGMIPSIVSKKEIESAVQMMAAVTAAASDPSSVTSIAAFCLTRLTKKSFAEGLMRENSCRGRNIDGAPMPAITSLRLELFSVLKRGSSTSTSVVNPLSLNIDAAYVYSVHILAERLDSTSFTVLPSLGSRMYIVQFLPLP